MCDLTNPIFTNKTAARKHLESIRWADGRFCPHCGATEGTSFVRGKKHRPGLYYCNGCSKQFTVTVGTVFERSKVPLHKWMLGYHLMCASKKGVSAHQLHRMLGVTYKTAWFMEHRIRESMKDETPTAMGGEGETVEADETYFGKKDGVRTNKRGPGHKLRVVGLVERGGRVRTFHVKNITSKTVRDILVANVRRDSRLMTDEAAHYHVVGEEFASHRTVVHSHHEYVRGEAYTNTIEGYFSIFKRGMKGIYQHCGERHLHRYLNEFDFRYNNRELTDSERRDEALKGIEGKRLTYRRTGERANV